MGRFIRAVSAVPIAAFALVAGVSTPVVGAALVGTASAAPAPLHCGSVITQTTTLTADIGPCASGDGLIVTGSRITLNLHGHTVRGSHGLATPSGTEQVGIHLFSVSNVAVTGGKVTEFDAGVAVNGGSFNFITGITATKNINVNLLTKTTTTCNYGDGITLDNSNNNKINNNTTTHNGPFSGISLVESSNGNVVNHNVASANNYEFIHPGDEHAGRGGGPLAVDCQGGFARTDQGIGIRVEGPNATNNQILNNTVAANTIFGISIAGSVCNPPPRLGTPSQSPNINNLIQTNTVSGTGPLVDYVPNTSVTDPSGDSNGIGILRQGPTAVVCVSNGNSIISNTSTGNARDGIFIGGPAGGSTDPGAVAGSTMPNSISGNTLTNNGRDGIHLSAGALNDMLYNNKGTGNAGFDGADLNGVGANPPSTTACDNNNWNNNRFNTVNQTCVASGATGTGGVTKVIPTGASGSTPNLTLTTTWSAPVTIVDPTGFSVFSDANCTSMIGTGSQALLSGNGTMTLTVKLDVAPPPSTRSSTSYYEVLPNTVAGPGGIQNAQVGCTPVRFAGPAVPATSTVSAPAVTCGTTAVGVASSCTPTVTITNTAPAGSGRILTFTNPVLSSTNGDFTQNGGTCAPGVLNPGTSCTVTVAFKPAAGQTGSQTGTITVNDNGLNAETFTASGTVSG